MNKYIYSFLILLVFSIDAHANLDTLINIGTYNLHFKILKGRGTPILFESGGGLDASQWDSISKTLHKKLGISIITYDRSGFGQSGIDTLNYNILNEIRALEFALTKLGYQNTNMFLVCHSLGAFYSRLYANRHPKLVKGIIMLDPRIPSSDDMIVAKKIAANLNRNNFSKEELGLYYVLTEMEQNSDFLRSKTIADNIPVLDIMAEEGPFETKQENDAFKLAQRIFIQGRKKGSFKFAGGSSHNIPQDNPQLVVSEIVKFYRKQMK